jgi:hypothetical protein
MTKEQSRDQRDHHRQTGIQRTETQDQMQTRRLREPEGGQQRPAVLTNLEVGVGSQGLIDQPVTLGVPWTQVHDVALSLLICEGHGRELARSRRKWTEGCLGPCPLYC